MASSPPDSRAEVEVVRKPLRARGRSSRTLDERLAMRFPRLVTAFSRLIGRLPPSSRLRQAVLVRGLELAAAAYNRGDLEAVAFAWRPDFEYRPASNLVDAGLIEPSYHGLPGYRAYVAAAAEVWGDETRFEPLEYVDLGDRLVVLAEAPLRAQASGVPLTLEFAYVTTLEEGRVVRQEEFHDHGDALAAVGLPR
jgi:ketosteroid isomerase-like protein